MTIPRQQQVALEATPYYHCVSRCVRRAFLCGKDSYTGQDYEHRRGWLEERLLAVQSVFCIDICAYAIMSNHYHVVLHVNLAEAEALTDLEVIERWCGLFKGSVLTERYRQGEALTQAESKVVFDRIQEWRERLTDISWFIRCCNEWLARESNKEDLCTGRFWEGRFKSQALLDEKALAACMAYVDLNPLRAKLAKTPESSDYTSVKTRAIKAKQFKKEFKSPNSRRSQPINLFPFVGNPRKNMPVGLPFKLEDYLELVDWTGRQIRKGKRGAIAANEPPILSRLGISSENWMVSSTQFESQFKGFAGVIEKIRTVCESLGRQRASASLSCLG